MLEKDVKIGMKVVPFRKTVLHYSGFEKWLDRGSATIRFFKKNGFLFVANIIDNGVTSLSDEKDVEYTGGDYFNASDFEPYIEPAKDNDFQATFVHGNKTIVYLSGQRKGASNCSPSDIFDPVKGFALAYMRALGQTVDDIRIEINPKQSAPQEDKPFEVGETVKIIGSAYGFGKFHYQEIGKIEESHKPSNGNYRVFGYWFPDSSLEKVPQPAKHEVIIDGVKYVSQP